MGPKRILQAAVILFGAYLAISFGKPYYQYLMMYQAFGDAVDAGIARIQVVKTHTGADVSEEVLEAVQAFLGKCALDLGVPLDARDIQIRLAGGHLEVWAAWVVPVKVLMRTTRLNFSLHQDRKLPQ